MDANRVNDLIVHTKEAYDAEINGKWSQAYDLHEKAMRHWKEFAGTMARLPNMEDKLYKQVAEKRVELHKSRLDTIRPFAKGGKPVPGTVTMHPSSSLIKRGLWDFLSPAEMPLSEESTARLLSLTMVRHLKDDTSSLRQDKVLTTISNNSQLQAVPSPAYSRTRHPFLITRQQSRTSLSLLQISQ
jgi:hypothetical protein